jgi:hypothetical protein
MIDTHGMRADEAAAAVRRITNARALDLTAEREEAHPEHPGGRVVVLDAVRERRERLLEIPEPRRAPRWTTNEWRGHTNYQCKECPFATLDRGAMVKHAATRHPRAWESEEAAAEAANPLAGIVFASDEAAEHAAQLTTAEVNRLKAQTPSGKGGYTVADVRAASPERS